MEEPPSPIGPMNFFRVYSFGINRELINLDYDEYRDEYTVSLNTSHWFWKWCYNGKPVTMENGNSYTFSRSGTGRTQVICFQCDSEGNPSGGAVMVEI